MTHKFHHRFSKFFLFLLFLLPFYKATQAQSVKEQKLTNFDMQSTYVITDNGRQLTSENYVSKNHWFPVTIPTTVLSGLVKNNIYPDPYIGMNNMLIPDASDEFNEKYNLDQYSFLPHVSNPWNKPFWFKTSFDVPVTDKGKLFQLIFKGINYRAEVWVNGMLIADSSQMAGMFAEYAWDVSNAVHPGAKNLLAVKIYPLDYPGLPAHPQLKAMGPFYENGGPTGDIGKNVTMLCSVGWDWMPAVRDRNMGIWQPVFLRTSGKVAISQPQVITNLPKLPDTSLAEILLKMKIKNFGERQENGTLKIQISPENFQSASSTHINKKISIRPEGLIPIELTKKDFKQLQISNPHLWWPNGYGQPNLYRISFQFIKQDGSISDDTSFVFGIRTTTTSADEVNGWTRRYFYVNGKKIHLNGGAWVPDMMLNRDSLRYDQEIRLNHNANINLLRIWGGGNTPPDVFFELADRYGMLVWQDFWITGDTQGEFKGSPDWPLESDVFIRNMTSTIYRIRNHPSLLLWTGGNEGHARKELYDAMRDSIISIDGTRPFIPSSSGFAKMPKGWNQSWPDNKPSGVYSGGPYSWEDPSVYFQKVNAGKDWLFKDETGLPSQPTFNSLARIIPDLVPDTALPYPLNNTWGYHDAATGNGRYDLYYDSMAIRYGAPVSMKDFSDKMQLMNANGYRGIFEAAGSKLNETGGVMLWKLNAAFPSVIWQVYDWYLEPNAGYYFMQNAVAPLHIQLNLDDSSVAIINRTYHSAGNLSAEIDVYNLNGEKQFHNTISHNTEASSEGRITSLAGVLQQQKGISFVSLRLKDKHGETLSSNTYWLEPNHDYTSLKNMPQSKISAKIEKTEKLPADHIQWTVRFTNTSMQLAFFVNPQLFSGGEEVLPAYWSDNYFSLAPGESASVKVSCKQNDLKGKTTLKIEGWNIPLTEINLP